MLAKVEMINLNVYHRESPVEYDTNDQFIYIEFLIPQVFFKWQLKVKYDFFEAQHSYTIFYKKVNHASSARLS